MSQVRTTSPYCILFSLLVLVAAGATVLNAKAQQSPDRTAQQQGPIAVDVQNTLAKIDQTAQAAALDIAKLRIERWKTDSKDKQQAQSDADSVQRNLTTALPTLTSGVRNAPQDIASNFKLYRNLNALFDVLKSLTEAAGAFGPKQDFESLAQYAQAVDEYRRTMGDYMENLATAKDAELNRLRSQARATQAPASPPKKVIVDDDAPAPAPKKKITKKKPPASTPPANPTSPQ